MQDQLKLMIPGPTQVPQTALQALARQPISHRSSEFNAVMAEVTENLQWLHQTQNDVLMLAGSGTAAMEAGIINFLSPGDRVIVGANGKFGDRWAELCKIFGLEVETITAEWGKPLVAAEFATKLEADTQKEIKAVIITHSETSTGVINDLENISHHIKNHGQALSIIDAVTSLGSVSVPVDAWGLDVVVSGSQKGYMVPPGLGIVAVSTKAWAAYQTAKFPKYYLDLEKYRLATINNTSPFTPPVNLIVALQTTLKMMQQEGLAAIFARHRRVMKATRAAIRSLNLTLFAQDDYASSAVTAVNASPLEADKIREVVKKRFDIEIAGGQDHLKNKIFRIGHLGFIGDRDILTCISALEAALLELGYQDFTPGAGITAAIASFSESNLIQTYGTTS
jgi:aspartate aminotransferase-like enzyme